jgi:hypothetical protein
MGFKTNHGGAVGGRKIYLRNYWHQVASQPTEVMIGLAICFGDLWFLPVIGHLRNFVVCHLDDSKGHRRRSCWSIALYSRVVPAFFNDRRVSGGKGPVSFTDHGEWNGSDTVRNKGKQKKIGRWKSGSDGIGCIQQRSALYA